MKRASSRPPDCNRRAVVTLREGTAGCAPKTKEARRLLPRSVPSFSSSVERPSYRFANVVRPRPFANTELEGPDVEMAHEDGGGAAARLLHRVCRRGGARAAGGAPRQRALRRAGLPERPR